MTNVNIEDLSDVKKRVTLEVDPEKVNDVVGAQYDDLKKNIQIKGFRKGKAPLSVIKSYFKKQIQAEAARKLIDETFEPALKQKNLRAISVLSLDPGPVEEGEAFKYTAEIEVPPKIDVTGYEGINLEKTERQIDESVIDERLENIRQSKAILIPLEEDQGLSEGDYAVVDIDARDENGDSLGPLTVREYHLEINREFYLPGFDEQIKGMLQGESKEIELELPETYPNKEMAGKKGHFTVTVKEGKTRQAPELDDDFAQDLGDYETLQELRDEIRKSLEKAYEMETKKELENQIMDALLEANPFDAPESMVENRIDGILNQSLRSLALQGIDPNRLPPPTPEQRERIRPDAQKHVKFSLILNSLAEKEAIEVSEDEVEKSIQERAEEMGVTSDFMKDQLEESNAMEDFKEGLKDEKAIDMIIEKANVNVTEKQVDPEELAQE